MKDRETPSYFATIPAEVRYSKHLTPNAKLLYGEITCLCNKLGYCWATNGYFAKLYNKDKATISVWINSLHKNGFIKCNIENNTKRKIYLPLHEPIRKICKEPLEKSGGIYNTIKESPVRSNDTDGLVTKKTFSFDDKLAIKLEKKLRQERKLFANAKTKNWPRQFEMFRVKNNVKKKRLSRILKWYIKNFDDRYVPKAFSAQTFCNSFLKIEAARDRTIDDIANGKVIPTAEKEIVSTKIISGSGSYDGMDDDEN